MTNLNVSRHQPSEQIDPPFPTEAATIAILARRARITRRHASVVVYLAGLGLREAR